MAHAAATGWQCFEPECGNRSTGSPCKYPTGDFQVTLKESELNDLISKKIQEDREKRGVNSAQVYTRGDMDYMYEVGKREGWDEGYDACYQGKQRHSPYKQY